MRQFFMMVMGAMLALGLGLNPAQAADNIKIGLLSDLSGATSSVGAPYADGIKAAAAYINANGGIAGQQSALLQGA